MSQDRDYIVRATAAEGSIRAFAITSRHLVEEAARALGMRAVYNMLRENELDALLQQDRIDVENKEVTIRTENETLVVEGNLSQTFQRVQQLLCEQYQIIWRVC